MTFLNQSASSDSRFKGLEEPNFSLVIAFEYYDGPEDGLALWPSGEGMSFRSIGDSPSRRLRAFLFAKLQGLWDSRVRTLDEYEKMDPSSLVMVPRDSEKIRRIEQDVQEDVSTEHYLGVGDPNFERLQLLALTEEQYVALEKLGCSPEGYRLAHRMFKDSRNTSA